MSDSPFIPGDEPGNEPIESESSENSTSQKNPVPEKNVEPEEDGQPAPNLERLQKILAQAGIASRRHAEELITAGRVQINGQVVSVLGTKADPARDHIRVDGKLLQGAERLRYFVLNKPRGYVTTVSDPEGRPTVMEFFAKFGERLYPVGRLDYLSEGLLLVTNDGELANSLTRASAGVEKTYIVKVAGQPSEEVLEKLRQGVAIDKTTRGEGKVRTAPAKVKQLRPGDNPWFEVVLTEGRNRELRKMFEEVGHHVEKIRRVGYGPLMLDVEPGQTRELELKEVELLRLTAAGKMKPKRVKSTYMLPKDAGLTTEERERKKATRGGKPFRKTESRGSFDRDRKSPAPRTGPSAPRRDNGPAIIDYPLPSSRPPAEDFTPRPSSSFKPRNEFPARSPRPAGEGFKPRPGGSFKPRTDRPERSARPAGEGFKPRSEFPARSARPTGEGFKPRSGAPTRARSEFPPRSARPAGEGFKPRSDRPERSARPVGEGFKPRPGGSFKPRSGVPARGRSEFPTRSARPAGEGFKPRPSSDFKPRGDRPERSTRPAGEGFKPRPSGNFKPRSGAPARGRSEFPARSARPAGEGFKPRSSSDFKPRSDRPERSTRPTGEGFKPRPSADSKPRSSARPASAGRPARGAGSSRPFTTSSGIPRAGGARPSSKPGRSGSKSSAGKGSFGGKPKTGGGKSFGAKPGGFKKPGSFGGAKKGPGFKGKSGPGGKPARRP